MANIRRVTMNPPTMLMVAINTEIDASTQTNQLPVPICNSAPRMMMPEIALVTAISGVCKAWLTFQMTWNPTKHAKTTATKCCRNYGGATNPDASSAIEPMPIMPTC